MELMKLVVLFLILLSIFSPVFSQAHQIELKFALSDTIIANKHFNKATDLTYWAKYDSANLYFKKASKIYEQLAKQYNRLRMWEKFVDCYNCLGDNYRIKCDFKNALPYLNKALEVGLKYFGENHRAVATSYHNIGLYCYYWGEFAKMRSYIEKSLSIRINMFGTKHLDVADSYEGLGYLEIASSDYGLALDNINKALSIRLELVGENHPYTASSYYGLYRLHYFLKDFEESFKYAERSLILKQRLFGKNHPEIALCYIGYGNYYQSKKLFDKALEYNQKATDILLRTFSENHHFIIATFTNMAIIYGEMESFDMAVQFHKKAQAVIKQLYGENPWFAYSCQYLGEVYFRKGENNNALIWLNKSLALQADLGITVPLQLARLHNWIGKIYLKKRDYKAALNHFQKSMLSFIPDCGNSIYQNPDIKSSFSHLFVLDALSFKADTFNELYWNKTKNIRDIQASLSNYELAAELLNKMRREYTNEKSRLALSERVSQIFDRAIQTSLQLYEITGDRCYQLTAFEFAQQGKSASLALSMQESHAKKNSGIPKLLLEKELSLRDNLAHYKTEIQKEMAKKVQADSMKLMNLNEQLFSSTTEYERLIAQFEKSYPQYYNLKYRTKTASVPNMKKSLDTKTALMEYFVSAEKIYIFLITREKFDIKSLAIDSTFFELVDSYRSSIRSDRKERFITSANKLYELLVAPVSDFLTGKQNLVLIPHGVLYTIPFEAFLVGAPIQISNKPDQKSDVDYHELVYLVRHFNISYHYTATLYSDVIQKDLQLSTETSDYREAFVGFAPVFRKGSDGRKIARKNLFDNYLTTLKNYAAAITRDGENFNELPLSEAEVMQISKEFEKRKMKSENYFHEKATKENFKRDIGNYKYVHLATHSFVNEDNPELSGIAFFQPNCTEENVFDDGILYSEEAYNLNLNADLVVLSSCESGIGKIIKGEGMMALTRGFLYSGAKNILVTLWKIDDQHASQMMVDFYKQMLSGNSYAEALRQAKLKLINNKSSAKPLLWSGFVLIGN